MALELVGNAEFLAKPDDAFGLGNTEVVDDEHGDSSQRSAPRVVGIGPQSSNPLAEPGPAPVIAPATRLPGAAASKLRR